MEILEGRPISRRKKHSLGRLFRRFVWGVGASLVGAWLVAALRLNVFRTFWRLDRHPSAGFGLELLAFALTFFGLLTAASVWSQLRTRIRRLESLGEKDW